MTSNSHTVLRQTVHTGSDPGGGLRWARRVGQKMRELVPRHSISTMPHRIGWYLSLGDLAEIGDYATIVGIGFCGMPVIQAGELGYQARRAWSLKRWEAVAYDRGGIYDERAERT